MALFLKLNQLSRLYLYLKLLSTYEDDIDITITGNLGLCIGDTAAMNISKVHLLIELTILT